MAQEKGYRDNSKLLGKIPESADSLRAENGESKSVFSLRCLFDNFAFQRISAFMTHSSGFCDVECAECAYGSVGGKPVFAFSEGSGDRSAVFSYRNAEKIKLMYKRALGSGTPVVAILDSLGGMLEEGSSLLSAYGELAKCVSAAKGMIPQIAIISGKCTGILSGIAQMFDFVVTTKQSELYFFPNNETTRVEAAECGGNSAFVADNIEAATGFVRKLIGFLPMNKTDSKFIGDTEDDINRMLGKTLPADYSVEELIGDISDCGDFLPLWSDYATCMIVGFATFDGILAGVVANNHSVNDGAISANGAEKVTRFIDFCASFGVPILTLVDTVGFEVSAENNDSDIMQMSARLMHAYASAECAKLTVIIGKAYGAGFTVMGSRALGADLVLALRSAMVAAMPPERAVAFSENERITPEKGRDVIEEEWALENSPAVLAAAKGDIDDIVELEFLRAHVVSAVGMFSSKSKKAADLI